MSGNAPRYPLVPATEFGEPPDPTPARFVQPAGDEWVDWTVVEVDAHGLPGAHGAHCLIFSRQDCIRRVWDYPPD
jgi:hypothetical protein